MCEGIARPFCSPVSDNPQELLLPSAVCGTGKGKAGAEHAKDGAHPQQLWLTAGGKRPWARYKSARGELLGRGKFITCPGKAGGTPCNVLLEGCCCASIGETIVPLDEGLLP